MLTRTPLRLAPHLKLTTSTSTTTNAILPLLLLPRNHQNQQQHRLLHSPIAIPPVPKPTPFVPDTTTFLTLIGRKLSTHASKIPSWDALFTLTSPQLKNLGIEPPRARRYLLRWRDKFRNGEFGIGGDLSKVGEGGRAEVRCVEVPWDARIGKGVRIGAKREQEVSAAAEMVQGYAPAATLTRSPGTKKVVVNVRAEEPVREMLAGEALKSATRVAGVKQKGANTIYGSHVEPVKGSGGSRAIIRVKEGLWEHVRGHKVDGGERRKAEVRAKRRSAERKAQKA